MKLQYNITFLMVLKAICSYPTPSEDVLNLGNRSSSEIFSISTSIPLFASEDTSSPTDQKFYNVDDSTTETLILPTSDLDIDDNFEPLVTTYKATEGEINLVNHNLTSDLQGNGASSTDQNAITTPLLNVVHGTSTNQTSYNYIESQNHTVSSWNIGNNSDILDSHEALKDLIAVALEEVSNTSSEASILEPIATQVDMTTKDDMFESKDFDNATVLVSENLDDSHIK